MILVDSSVWIDLLRGADTAAVRFVQEREHVEEVALTAMIYLEVMHGVRTESQFDATRAVLEQQLMLEASPGLVTYNNAAQLYRMARRAGKTVRKSTDRLIAAISLEHGAVLVHNDRDLTTLATIEPALVAFPHRAQ